MIEFKDPQDMYLRNVQTRPESHGEDQVLAIDLAVQIRGPNRLLDMVHPELRAAMFKPAGSPRAGELDLPVDTRPGIRLPKLGWPLKWQNEQHGMTLHVAYGASGKADMVLTMVKLSKIHVTGQVEGGTVEMRFTMTSADNVSEKVIGKLSLLQKHTISATLKCAEVEDAPPPGPTPDEIFGPPDPRRQQKTPEQALIETQ